MKERVSLVSISGGTKLKPIRLDIILAKVPRSPDVEVENRSKLNSWLAKPVAMNYLINEPSGLMHKYITVRIYAIINGTTEIMAKSILWVLNAYDVHIELLRIQSNKYAKLIDSTLSIYSYLDLFQAPRYVGKGVKARSIEAILPRVARKSINLFSLTCVFSFFLLF